jgi:hypothetical protein
LRNITTATNHHTTIGVLSETVFSAVVLAEECRDKVKTEVRTALARASSNCKRQAHPLFREDVT